MLHVRERARLPGIDRTQVEAMRQAARELAAMGPEWVLVKGHRAEAAVVSVLKVVVAYGGIITSVTSMP